MFWVNLTGTLWSLFLCSIDMLKWKTGHVWSNTLFHCNVSTFPELHYCGYEMKMKRGSGVWYIWSVKTVRKTAAAEASWLMISSTLLFHLQNYRTCIVPSRAGPCRGPFGGAGAPRIKGAHGTRLLMWLCSLLIWYRNGCFCIDITADVIEGQAS